MPARISAPELDRLKPSGIHSTAVSGDQQTEGKALRNAFAKGAVVIAATACLGVTGATAAMASSHPHNGVIKNTSQNCGTYCDEIYSAQLGDAAGDPTLNAYIPGQTGNPGSGGQDINMRYVSNTDPNEDFRFQSLGTVSPSLCRSNAYPNAPLNSSSVPCRDYPGTTAYQIAFVPNGDSTGYCVGTSGTPGAGVTLQATLRKCGSTEGTIFIATSNTGSGASFGTLVAGTDYAFISGATSTYSDPDVLTVDAGSTVPANLVSVTQENVYGYGSGTPSVESRQQFSYSQY